MKRFFRIVFGRVVITGICLLIQIVGMIYAMYILADQYIYFSIVSRMAAFILALRITARWDNAAYKMVWVFVILSFPIFGLCLYGMFGHQGVNFLTRRRFARLEEELLPFLLKKEDIFPPDCYVSQQLKYIRNHGFYPVSQNTDVKYYPLADDALFDMLEALKSAKRFIFLEYFAIEDGEAFRKIEQILKLKVQEGVDVRIIFDDFGSIAYVKKEFIKRLTSEGIECRVFNPLLPVLYVFMNHRDHRKIMVIDGTVSFSGGFNLPDEYFNLRHPYGHWKDTGIRLMGDAVRNHTFMFLEMWNFIRDTKEDLSLFLDCGEYKAKTPCGYVLPYSDTPTDRETLGENVYMNVIKHAKRYVYITTPYLIVDDEMTEELCMAAKRGIDVRIIVPGIPDKKTVYLLTQSYFARLIKAGVKIYRYTPGFIHAKQYLCDDEIGVIGTINMDFRSLYLHFECATYLYQVDALSDMKKDFEETFSISEQVCEDYDENRSWYVRFRQLILRLLAPLF